MFTLDTARQFRKQRSIKLNIGCGPFGHAGWVNLDLYAHPSVTIRVDCRRRLPLANGSCRGIHCEHFFEHLDHGVERAEFLTECLRCLEDGGILRIVVPDGELFVHAYLSEGWSGFCQIAAEGDCPENDFATKMEALNHVFVQGYEHYGAYDTETLTRVLHAAGFRKVTRQSFGTGSFPDGCIDRPRHRRYSLYIEAEK
jgi:predicted SAM-dependent methyltransferase